MKEPTFAPVYATLYPVLAEAARKCGYALALHGTMTRDLDLIAVPWTDEALCAHDLFKALIVASRGHITPELERCEHKPNGRMAYSILLDNGAFIDLSVMPRIDIGEYETYECLEEWQLDSLLDAWQYAEHKAINSVSTDDHWMWVSRIRKVENELSRRIETQNR